MNPAIETALLRPVIARETESLLAFLAVQRGCYAANPGDAEKLLNVGLRLSSADLKSAESASWASLSCGAELA